MKKKLLFIGAVCILSACQANQPQRLQPMQCPSCDPPVRRYEVVTECTNYRDRYFANGDFSQCRICTNKVYSEGVDVTESFKKGYLLNSPKAPKNKRCMKRNMNKKRIRKHYR